MEFIWHDGGRASCGFVGLTSDCVARSVAIATGEVYREVYDSLSKLSPKTARHGISQMVIDSFLKDRGWEVLPYPSEVSALKAFYSLPKGVALVQFEPSEDSRKLHGHLSCVVDHTIYDTWNPFEDPSMRVAKVWTCATVSGDATVSARTAGSQSANNKSRLTQREYDRILNRVKALHRTASNHASTEGEVRNALRAMQSLMIEHNLGREDIVDDDDVSRVGMTRRACPLNSKRAYRWQTMLAVYLTEDVFPTVQYYKDRCGHRTLFWFYGPVSDVDQILGLFRELLITIASAATLKYGGHARGSGASYAEGYVNGLPKKEQADAAEVASNLTDGALVQTRALAITLAARKWLEMECDVRIQVVRSSRRTRFDETAHRAGKRDGAKHEYTGPNSPKRITDQRGS